MFFCETFSASELSLLGGINLDESRTGFIGLMSLLFEEVLLNMWKAVLLRKPPSTVLFILSL